MIIAPRTQFHVEKPWGQRPFSIVSYSRPSLMMIASLNQFQPGEGPSRGFVRDYEPSCWPSFEALTSPRHSSSSPCKPKCKFPNFIFHRVLNLNLWPQSPFQISSIELIWLFSLELQLRFTDRYAFVPSLCKLAKILPIIHIFRWLEKKNSYTLKFECIVCEMHTLKIVLG